MVQPRKCRKAYASEPFVKGFTPMESTAPPELGDWLDLLDLTAIADPFYNAHAMHMRCTFDGVTTCDGVKS